MGSWRPLYQKFAAFFMAIAASRGYRHNLGVKKAYLLNGVFCLAILCAIRTSVAQSSRPVPGDDSDWWSRVTEAQDIDLSAPETHTQHRELLSSTLEIATVRVGTGEISRAAKKLGRTVVVQRGDAAESRAQACYFSKDSRAHLIFQEDGEGFGGAFYLFSGGPDWNGSRLCSRFSLDSQQIGTPSGLRLGLSPNEVEAILGKPSKASADKLTYILEAQRKTSPSALKQLRAQNPNLSEDEFRDDFGSYYVDSFVIAKFSDSKLDYLAVTRYESYP